jgi:hypothetical protein
MPRKSGRLSDIIRYRLYIKEENKLKTAFKTKYRYFKYLIILFSLANASTIF